jgi:hypothetical protein
MMSHRETIEATYDGKIPAHLKARAAALDALAPIPPFIPAARKPGRRFADADALVAAMAELMIERAVTVDACTEPDLLAAGFSRAEISLHASRAATRAARLMADRARARL